MRRHILRIPMVMLLIVLSGCTSALFDKANTPKHVQYNETVSQILISGDGRQLVILGPKYHYILDAPAHFDALLDSPLHPKVQANISTFQVNAAGQVWGKAQLILTDCNSSEWLLAKSFGFVGNAARSIMNPDLVGKRYMAGEFTLPANIKPLNKAYTISVDETLAKSGHKALLLLTPLTVAADGALFLSTAPLLPLYGRMLGEMGHR